MLWTRIFIKFNIKKIVSVFIFIFMLMPIEAQCENISNDQAKKLNILFISSFGKDLPAQNSLEQGLNKTLKYKEGNHNVYFEFMDSSRLRDKGEYHYFEHYLNDKYKDIRFNFVIAWATKAGVFVCKNRKLFPGCQRVLLEVVEDELLKAKCYSEDDIIIVTDNDYLASLKNIFQFQHPQRVIVIGTTKDLTAKLRLSNFKDQIKEIPDKIEIEYVLDQDVDSISRKLQKSYAGKTIAFYLLMFSDGKGREMSPYQVIRILSKESTIPIFSYWDSLMGSGIVGGYLISLDRLGEYLGSVMLQYDQKSERHLTYSPMKYIYDYNSLKKWKINKRDIPVEAEIMNKPPDIFEYYKLEVYVALISTIFLIIFVFLIYRQFVIKKANSDLKKVKEELKSRNKELNYLSITDPLTGLRNRRAMEVGIADEINRNKRFGDPVSLLIMDLDLFKEINDTHGHSMGDEVLKKVSDAIIKSLRVTDKASRWGGDEFLILAVNTKLKRALILAERIRENVMSVAIGNIKNITVSIGVAEYVKGEDFLKWYERADTALYKAKESGRNKVVGEDVQA